MRETDKGTTLRGKAMIRENLLRMAVVWAILISAALFAVAVHAQDGYRPLHSIDSLDLGTGSLKELSVQGCGISQDEIDALEAYQASHMSIRAMIEASGRPFNIGTVGHVRPGNYGNYRICAWRPERAQGYQGQWYASVNWEEPEGEWYGCYYNEDGACDYRNGSAVPGCLHEDQLEMPFIDFQAYRNLIGYDFNYTGTNCELEANRVNRKKGSYYYGFADQIGPASVQGSFSETYDMKFTGQQLLYRLPGWVPYTVMTYDADEQPRQLARILLTYIDDVAGHYAGQIDRWGVANEAVRNSDVPMALSSAVDNEATQWCVTLAPGEYDALGTQFIRCAAEIWGGEGEGECEGEPEVMYVYAMVDDEIVRITDRMDEEGEGSGEGECEGEGEGDTVTIVVDRGQAGTEPAAHEAGAYVYTIRNLIKPLPTSKFSPKEVTDPDEQKSFWLWYTITDYANGRENDVSDIFLVEAFNHASDADPSAKLIYSDYGITYGSAYGVVNQKFENVKALLKLLVASGAPIDGVGDQMHIPAWSCLTYDANGMRLNPRQLGGIVESLTTMAQCVPQNPFVTVTEMDVRMGIAGNFPQNNDEYREMRAHVGDLWASANLEARQQLQGEVYKAVLNAMLAVPELYSVTFWGIQDGWSWLNWVDPSGWPWTPMLFDEEAKGPYFDCGHPNPDASNPCLLGARPDLAPCSSEGEGEGECEHNFYYPKPAYDGVREAFENYFGIAHVVRDQEGKELVRFVRNGNVIVLKGEIEEGYTNWTSTLEDKAFILLNSACNQQIAEITQDGDLCLANGVAENQSNLQAPVSGNALVIKNAQDEVVSMIDENGNLKTKGEVIVQGVPYKLLQEHPNDPYSTYQ